MNEATNSDIKYQVEDEIAFVKATADVLRVANFHGSHELRSHTVTELLGKIGDSMERLDGLVGLDSHARIVRDK